MYIQPPHKLPFKFLRIKLSKMDLKSEIATKIENEAFMQIISKFS